MKRSFNKTLAVVLALTMTVAGCGTGRPISAAWANTDETQLEPIENSIGSGLSPSNGLDASAFGIDAVTANSEMTLMAEYDYEITIIDAFTGNPYSTTYHNWADVANNEIKLNGVGSIITINNAYTGKDYIKIQAISSNTIDYKSTQASTKLVILQVSAGTVTIRNLKIALAIDLKNDHPIITLANGGTLKFEGDCELSNTGVSGCSAPVIDVGFGRALTLSGANDATLTVNSTTSGAAIGGGGGYTGISGGSITINSGTVNARAYYGAAIGGGGGDATGGSGGTITINGGTVNATSMHGAGIGGGGGIGFASGTGGAGGTILIKGGSVSVTMENLGIGAGIGGGGGVRKGGSGGTIVIDGASTRVGVLMPFIVHGAGIGGGGTGGTNSVGDGGDGGRISIFNGTVYAVSMGNGAAIGGGCGVQVGGDGGEIRISGGNVVAESENGAAIGGGFGIFSKGGDGGFVSIEGADTYVRASIYVGPGAGIGGGGAGGSNTKAGNGASLSIIDATVVTQGANVSYSSNGIQGYDIGSGYAGLSGTRGTGGSLTIDSTGTNRASLTLLFNGTDAKMDNSIGVCTVSNPRSYSSTNIQGVYSRMTLVNGTATINDLQKGFWKPGVVRAGVPVTLTFLAIFDADHKDWQEAFWTASYTDGTADTFSGNPLTYTMPARDVTLKGDIRGKLYNITYKGLAADASNPNPDAYRYQSSFTLQDPSQPGWHFVGWHDAETGGSQVGAILNTEHQDKELWARWLPIYQITYHDVENASNPNPSSYIFGSGFALEDPARFNNLFVGWFDAETGGSQVTAISSTDSSNKELWARWITLVPILWVQVTAPVKDATPITAAPPAAYGYTCSSITWSRADGNPMDLSFEAGKDYTATVVLTAEAGFQFLEDFWLTAMNEYDAVATHNPDGTVTLSCTFPATEYIIIAQASINITAPVAGQMPETTLTTSDAHYSFGTVTWVEYPSYAPVSVGGFEADKLYRAVVQLYADGASGYAFSAQSKVGINGNNATSLNYYPGTNSMIAAYVFPALHQHTWESGWQHDDGTHWHLCSLANCSATTTPETHTPDYGRVALAPTLTATGIKAYHCTVCGLELKDLAVTLPMLEPAHVHIFSNGWSANITGHWHECSCGARADEAGHTPSEWVVVREPDGYGEGIRHKACTVCGFITDVETFQALVPDITPPTGVITLGANHWDAFTDDISFDLFFPIAQSVSIVADDDSGEVVAIEFYLASEDLSEAQIKALDNSYWSAYVGPFDCSPNNSYIIYVRLTDTSGNEAYLCSDGIVLDDILPEITGVTNGGSYGEAVTAVVYDSFLDTVSINGTLQAFEGSVYAVLLDTSGSYTIVATDKAGNQSSVSISILIVVPTQYAVIKHFGLWSGSDTAVAQVGADAAKFTQLMLDGNVVNPNNYTVTEGSTIIALTESYLKTFDNGDYVFRAEFTDGYADINLTVQDSTDNGNGGDTPGGDTPGGDTPGGDTPGGDTPGGALGASVGDSLHARGWSIALLAAALVMLFAYFRIRRFKHH